MLLHKLSNCRKTIHSKTHLLTATYLLTAIKFKIGTPSRNIFLAMAMINRGHAVTSHLKYMKTIRYALLASSIIELIKNNMYFLPGSTRDKSRPDLGGGFMVFISV